MKKLMLVAFAALSLAGCKSAADRMYECESHGVSRDACYMAEQNRQASMNNAAQNAAYQNARDAVKDTDAEPQHKHHHKHHDEESRW
ncbi:TPA: hypothetical protein JG832_002420 [Enterobacter hormaechei subsp. xiangfangensis]|nr:hypothetical protein [Enterobacter hormaechei subsp. xiangfangensis]HAV1890556.1 hypothetical protein [Enterobacter hormaechei subsp. xiangfangensis]